MNINSWKIKTKIFSAFIRRSRVAFSSYSVASPSITHGASSTPFTFDPVTTDVLGPPVKGRHLLPAFLVSNRSRLAEGSLSACPRT
jgi:hypothetical protein